MPREGKPGKEGQRERMRRYRQRLRIIGRPEASVVDVAVAAAVAGYVAQAAKDPAVDVAVLQGLLRDTVDRLVAAGNSRQEARRKVIRRFGRFFGVVSSGVTRP